MSDTEKPRGWLNDHLTLVATVLFFVAIGLKLLFITAYDIDAALGLLRASGPATVALGSFIAGLRSFAFMIALAAGLWLEWHWKDDEINPLAFGFVVAAGFFGAVATIVLYDLVILPFIIGAPFLGRWMKRRDKARGKNTDLSWRAISAVVWLLVTTSFMTSDMWLPPEQIKTRDGEIQTAYVLEDEGRWVTLLDQEHRVVHEIEEGDIETRSICYEQVDLSFWSTSLWDLLSRQTPSVLRPSCSRG